MNFNENHSIYLQIADSICENILADSWKANERIPSVREYAIDIAVNPNTVMRSYSYLLDKDILTNQRGVGYFVHQDGKANALKLLRDDFNKTFLPEFFKKIKLLGISVEDIVKG